MSLRHLWLVVLLVVAAGCTRKAGPVAPPEDDEGPAEGARTNGIYYLALRGSPAERGRRHGAQLKQLIRDQAADYHKQLVKHFGDKNAARVLDHVLNQSSYLADIKAHLPDLHAEMQGIAEGSGVAIQDILLLNLYEEVYEGAPLALGIQPLAPPGKCTTLHCAARPGAANLNAQNLDYTPNLNGAQVMIHFTYPSGLKLLLYTFAGQVGGIGVNSKGLSMMCNTLPEGSKRKNRGLGGSFITRGLLEQGSAAEAVAWLEKMPQFSAYNYSLVDNAGGLMVEYSPKGLARMQATEERPFLAHANHLLKLADRNEVPGYPKGRPSGTVSGQTLARQKAADDYLVRTAASATVNDLKELLTTPPVNNSGEWMTLQSLIVVHDADDLHAYASAGNRPGREWNVYRLK